MNQEEIKEEIAEEAIHFIKDNMMIRLGTGTTASMLIRKLVSFISEKKLKIMTVASSILIYTTITAAPYMNQEETKVRIAEEAMHFIKDDMIIGLGTGTTASAFIRTLANFISEKKLKIMTVASSIASEKLALSLNIPCTSINLVSHIDITFDGADEIDEKKRLIKGAGGALLREKIVAMASSKFIVLIEEKKCSLFLGKSKLPVEILPFGYTFTLKRLTSLGYNVRLRTNNDNTPYVTDNGNYIADIALNFPCETPEKEEIKILSIPGVIETGFFLKGISNVIIGKPTGEILIL